MEESAEDSLMLISEMYTTAKVNVQTEANIESDVYTQLNVHTAVQVLEIDEEWRMVLLDGEKYIISSKYLRDNMCYFWKSGKWLICWISRVVGVTEKCLI